MKYAVGRINFFDNDLKVELVEAETPEAAVLALEPDLLQMFEDGEEITLERLKEFSFDSDSMVGVCEVPTND